MESQLKVILKNLKEADGGINFEKASKACMDYFATASESERREIGDAMVAKADEMLAQSKEARRQGDALIAEYFESKKKINIEIDGKKFPLSEWVTMKEYCRRFGLKNTMVLSNWITRKIVPEENVLRISQLNDLTLVKAVPYKV